MWQLIVKLFSAVSFVTGIVGWITLPDDAPLWTERLGPVLSAMTKHDLVMALFGFSALGFLATFIAPLVRPSFARARAFSSRVKATWSALSKPPSSPRVGEKLELVYRIGEPFFEAIYFSDPNSKRTFPRFTERLIGARNMSPGNVHNIRVQVVSATQPTRGLPLNLPPRTGFNEPFSLAPGEMRLVRFIYQSARSDQPLGIGSFGGKGGPPCLVPCDVIVAAYANGTSTFKRLSLSLNDSKEIQIEPVCFGDLPGGVEPQVYTRFEFGPARPRKS